MKVDGTSLHPGQSFGFSEAAARAPREQPDIAATLLNAFAADGGATSNPFDSESSGCTK